jgi:hypothetical protein
VENVFQIARCYLPLVLFLIPTSVSAQAASTQIPLKVYQGYLTVVQGHILPLTEPLNFVIDTGTTRTVIDRRIGDHFGPTIKWGHTLHFNKEFPSEWVSIPEIRVGPLRAVKLLVTVLDLSQMMSAPVRIDAIVGLDVLRSGGFTLDYQAERMIFGSQPHLAHEAPTEPGLAYLTVQAEVGGNPVHLLVDTGSGELTLYKYSLGPTADQAVASKQKAVWGSVKGTISADVRTVPPMHLGGQPLGTTALILPGSPLPGVDGYLPIKSLKARRVAFDFQNHLLGWEN